MDGRVGRKQGTRLFRRRTDAVIATFVFMWFNGYQSIPSSEEEFRRRTVMIDVESRC